MFRVPRCTPSKPAAPTEALCELEVSSEAPDVRQHQVGAHRRGAVADQSGEVVGAPTLARAHHQRSLPIGAEALTRLWLPLKHVVAYKNGG